MRPLTPGIIAAWVFIGLLAFGPPLELPALPWLPIGAKPPFPADKLSVLVVEETADRTPTLESTYDAIEAAVKAAGGNWRKLDKNQPEPTLDEPWVQAAWKVKGPSTPWIAAATPRAGVNQALPANAADAIKLLSPLGVH